MRTVELVFIEIARGFLPQYYYLFFQMILESFGLFFCQLIRL